MKKIRSIFLSIFMISITIESPFAQTSEDNPFFVDGVDYMAIASKLVNNVAKVREGELVWIVGDMRTPRLMEALAICVRKAGGFSEINIDSPLVLRKILEDVPIKYLRNGGNYKLKWIEDVSVIFYLSEEPDPSIYDGISEERIAAARKANQPYLDKFSKMNIRTISWGNVNYPTVESAKFYNIDFKLFKDSFWRAINVDYERLRIRIEGVKKILSRARTVRITTKEGTDISFKRGNRPVYINDGTINPAILDKPGLKQVWLPAGEVYFAPLESSSTGRLVVPFTIYSGKVIKGIRMDFKNGKMTAFSADMYGELFKEALALAAGDKDVIGAVDFGVNHESKYLPGSTYFSYEMDGVVSITLGRANWAGSNNKSDFAHPFFLPNSTVRVDGVMIMKDGKWMIE